MKFSRILLFSLTVFFGVSSIASAEYCDMMGGSTEIVWIHIPRSQIQENLKTKISLNDKSFTLDRSERLFVEDALPKVNDTIVLNQSVASTKLPSCLPLNHCSDDEKERWTIIKKTDEHEPFLYDKETATINKAPYQCTYAGGRRGCWDLNEGAKLKILGFTSLEGILFALVRVESC